MTKTAKWGRRAVWGTFVVVMTIGCNPLTTIGFLMHREDRMPAQYPLRPKEGPKKDKDEEITVLVICGQRQSSGLPDDFVRTDQALAREIAKRMPEEAKANKEKVAVISQTKLDKFKMENPHWRTMSASKIGKQLGADYVLDITLSNIQVFQPGTRNMLYEGRAEAEVIVTNLLSETAEPQFYVHQFNYQSRTPDATELSIHLYKQGFVDRLAQEIIWKHLEHKPADGILAPR